MTSRERVEAVLDGRTPDRPPVMHVTFSSRVASEILGRKAHVGGAIQRWRESVAIWEGPDAHEAFVQRCINDAIDIAEAFGHDMIRPGYWRYRRVPTERIDEYTFRYDDPDGRWEILRLDPDTELYNPIDGSPALERVPEDLEAETEAAEQAANDYQPTEEDFEEILAVLARKDDTHAVRVDAAQTALSTEDPLWMEASLLRPDLCERLLDSQVTRSIKKIDFLYQRGARVFFGGGDMASELGPIYSPKVFHDLLVPRLKVISDHCHKLGAAHLFCTDGNVWAVAEDFYVHSGIDGHCEFDRKAGMDILKLHERFPHITMIGNISSYTLHTGSVEDVIAETRACVEEARTTGKVIVGCSNLIVPETPMRNVEAMIKTIEKYR